MELLKGEKKLGLSILCLKWWVEALLFPSVQHIAIPLAYDNLLPADWSYCFCLFFFWKAFSHLLQLINWITCPSLFGFLFLTSRLKSLLGPHFCQLCLFFWYCYDWCTPRFLPPGLGVFVLSKNTAESVVAFLPAHFNCSKDESVMSRVKVNEMHPPWNTTCSQILRTYL